ncbi:MAG: helix-turn-helix domain-containing protein [Clostridia bacterium]|nr:helix-turn-helix domain-containing protein [Clostridia bacterium]
MPNTLHLDSLIAPGEPAVRVMASYHTTGEKHDHDFYELVYVTEGFCLHDAGGSVTLLMEGDIFILKPWASHKYSGNRVTRIYNCVFGLEAVGDCLEELRHLPGLDRLFSPDLSVGTPRLHLTLSERKTFLRLIAWMHEECEAHPAGWRIRLKSLLNCLLVEYARAYQAHVGSDVENGAYSAYVAQALSYIDGHYDDCDLTVHGIAAQVGVSGDYLSRQFRRVIGIAAQEYLRRYRFARSMELLQAGSPVGEVARQVGFRSLCHFSREFKREMGITPSQYRTQND